jgi:YD repeat-containing protein
VAEFSSEGTLIRAWGTKGTAPGQLDDAKYLTVGPEGNIWLSEYEASRAQVFTISGEYLYGFGSRGSGPGQFLHADGIAVYGPSVYVLDTGVWWENTGNSRIERWTGSYSSFGSYGTEPGHLREPEGIATDPSGDVWVTDSMNSRVEEWNANGEFVRAVGSEGSGTGQFNKPTGIAADSKGNIWVSDTGNGRVEELSSSGVWQRTCGTVGSGNEQFYIPEGLTTDSSGHIFVGDRGNHRILEINSECKFVRSISKSGEEYGPTDVALDSSGNIWAAYGPEDQIAEYTPEGALVRKWGTTGAAPGQLDDAKYLTVGPEGNIWLSEYEASRAQVFTPAGEYLYGFASRGSEPGQFLHADGIAIYGPSVYVLDTGVWWENTGNSRIQKYVIAAQEGQPRSPQPGSTIEYNVPLSGSGVPNMSSGELAKWGQKDVPVYATAVFPPDERQGWPASDYRRAHISYLDSNAREVNIASPTGGVSTREYNEGNQATRTLSADNRAAALKEGCESETKCKSVEVAKLLDTENAYNSEEQLTDSWGPQHAVRLAVGKEGKAGEEALARNHIHYYYDEGAKEAEEKWHETYGLVTKTVDGAETASKEEFDKRTVTTSYSGQGDLGWKLRMPTSTTTDPGGLNLTSTTVYEESTGNIVETRSTAASGGDAKVPPAFALQFGGSGSENGKLSHPGEDAVDSSNNVWVIDGANNRVQKFSSSGAFTAAYGKEGSSETELQFKNPAGIAVNQKTGNIYVGDQANNRIVEMSPAGAFIRVFGKAGTGAGEFKEPEGLAVDSKGNVWVADTKNNRVQEFSEEGKYLSSFGAAGTGCGQFSTPVDIAIAGEYLYVTDQGNSRIEQFNEEGKKCIRTFGSAGTGNGQFKAPTGLAVAPNGNVYVADTGNARSEELTASGSFVLAFGAKGNGNGQFAEPQGLAFTASGTVYITDAGSNNRVQQWVPAVTGNSAAGDTKTIYYSAKAEAEVPVCREHPEWAGLPCQTKPVAQPGISGLPELPVTTITYNVWNQPEKVEEAFGSTTRTKKTAFDNAGRPLTSEETSSTAAAMPTVTDKYSSTTGLLGTKSTTSGETIKTLTSTYNTLGQLESYTDAEGKTTTFEYEKEGDGRVVKVSDAKGSQTYIYDETTGARKELRDSAAGTFSASYDVQGRMTSESYPNGMTAYYTYNATGATTGMEYKKLTHCTEKCTWFANTAVSSIHGETLKQTSTLAEEPAYTYDAAGRLTQVQEIPAGEGCKTRIYAYDESSNRTTETTREPGTEGKCASEGGSTEWHTYDTANSLADPGVSYDVFGNTIKLPAADAGGSELMSEYYLDGQVHVQEQSKEKIEYTLDPEERTLETISSGNTASKLVSHYDGPGGALAWKGEGSGETEKWTRNIPGIDGTLSAGQKGEGKTGQPAVLLLHDLKGNVVGEAALSETETKLLKTYNSTEFGVPNSKEAPPTYAWLGAAGVAGELPSGVITQDGLTYVPQTGRPLQTEGVALPAPGNAAAAFTRPIEEWVGSQAGEGAARELSKAEQERQEREVATPPPGVLPSGNPGWWCGEEYGPCECNEEEEGCGPDPSHGSNPWGCGVWVSWGHGLHLNEYLAVHGHWACAIEPAHIEIEIALLEVVGNKYVRVDKAKKSYYYPEGNSGDFSKGWVCIANHWYQAWVWGRTWDGWTKKTTWYATAEDGHWDKCPEGIEDPTQGPDQFR